jgi:hypothetical protein
MTAAHAHVTITLEMPLIPIPRIGWLAVNIVQEEIIATSASGDSLQ